MRPWHSILKSMTKRENFRIRKFAGSKLPGLQDLGSSSLSFFTIFSALTEGRLCSNFPPPHLITSDSIVCDGETFWERSAKIYPLKILCSCARVTLKMLIKIYVFWIWLCIFQVISRFSNPCDFSLESQKNKKYVGKNVLFDILRRRRIDICAQVSSLFNYAPPTLRYDSLNQLSPPFITRKKLSINYF